MHQRKINKVGNTLWPPPRGVCPICQADTTLLSMSVGNRPIYGCNNKDCVANAGDKGEWLFYARLPWLWMPIEDGMRISEKLPDTLTKIIFLCEKQRHGESIPVLGQCSKCGTNFSGLYSLEATAGFATEGSSLICDSCLGL